MAKSLPDASWAKYLYMNGVVLMTGYAITLATGTTIYYVTNTHNITTPGTGTFGNQTFTALGIKRTPIRSEDGTILNELEVGLDNADLAFKNNVMAGMYNNVACSVLLIFGQKGSTQALGYMELYRGYLDEPKGDEHWITFQLRPFSIFEREFPNRIFQVGCNWNFCDDICDLNITTYRVETTLSVQSDGRILTCAHGKAADYFVPGFVQLRSGSYNTWYRPVLTNDAGTITMRVPFGVVLPAGTSVRIQKLCKRTPTECINTFNNYTRFGGFPHVPKAPLI